MGALAVLGTYAHYRFEGPGMLKIKLTDGVSQSTCSENDADVVVISEEGFSEWSANCKCYYYQWQEDASSDAGQWTYTSRIMFTGVRSRRLVESQCWGPATPY